MTARRFADRVSRSQLARFAVVGGICTVLYLVLYALLRAVLDAQVANLGALFLSALANTALNRRLTFRLAGRAGAREHASGLIAFALGAGITAAALWLLHAEDPHAGTDVEVAVLLGATLVATVFRFFLFRRWVFASALDASDRPDAASSRT